MNKELLYKHLDNYLSRVNLDNDFNDLKERLEREEYYKGYTSDKIVSMDEEEFYEYISKLWAMIIWGNKHYIIDKYINDNGFENLKKSIAYLLYGNDSIEVRWDTFKEKIKGFGPAMMSELLCYINPNEYNEVFEYIKDKEIAVNVISKSGTTLEPSIAFDLMMKLMSEKYNDEELKKRVIVTTDKETGTLRELVNEKGYQSFVVPTIVGGRYSVFTPVGLLPIAVAGIDIEKLLLGVKDAMQNDLDVAAEYAIVRDIMYGKGKYIESFTIYDEKLMYFAEWLKQLFAESHGKEEKGILPISNINTRDLHSMGQYLQEGKNIIFETVIGVKDNAYIYIDKYKRDLNQINNIALDKVCEAHNNGYTPSSIIWLEKLTEQNLGELMQFFMFATIIGGYLLDINPFDQPGVQEYKKLITEGLKEVY